MYSKRGEEGTHSTDHRYQDGRVNEEKGEGRGRKNFSSKLTLSECVGEENGAQLFPFFSNRRTAAERIMALTWKEERRKVGLSIRVKKSIAERKKRKEAPKSSLEAVR